MRKVSLTVLMISMAVLASLAFSGVSAASGPAIKIGIGEDLTGGLAIQGRELVAAVEMFFAEKNWQAAKREIKIVTEDTKLQGAIAITKTKKMLQQDKINILMGYHGSGDALAIAKYVHEQHIPFITAAGAVQLTRDLRSPYIFRAMSATTQFSYPLGALVAAKGYKRAILMGIDYVAAREVGVIMKGGFEEKGGKIIDEMWSPFGTTDFSPYLAKIAGKKGEVDVILTAYWGPEAGRFVTQFDEYGLKSAIPIYAAGGFADEAASLPAMGKHGIGIRHLYIYSSTINTAANKRFVESFVKKTGRRPSAFGFIGYIQARMVWEALNRINGNIEDTSQFLAAMAKTDFVDELTGGRFHFDERQGIIMDHYLMEIAEVGGKVVNNVIETIPQVEDSVEKFPPSFFGKIR